MPELRNLRPDDYPESQRLLDTSYGFRPGFFGEVLGTQWSFERADWDHTYVLAEGARLVSLVRVFPLDLMLGRVRVYVGGIGSVCTDPEARGSGYMARLLDHAIARMNEEGFVLSVLWGDRHRYGAFGWEIAGKSLNLDVTRRGMQRIGIEPIAPATYSGEPEVLAQIITAYERHPYHRRRAPEEYGGLAAHDSLAIYHAGSGETFGYVTIQDEGRGPSLQEFGGCPATVLGLARERAEAADVRGWQFRFPSVRAIPPQVWDSASGYHIGSIGSIRIMDLERTLELLSAQEDAGPLPGLASLRELSPLAQVNALFGTLTPSPLNVFVWGLDHI